MPKCIELSSCDWLIRNLHLTFGQVCLIKWPLSIALLLHLLHCEGAVTVARVDGFLATGISLWLNG